MSKNNSTFLIKSTQNKSFGTAFCINQDSNGSFLLTCKHVIEACDKEHLDINGLKAEFQVSSSQNELIDLAVVYVKGLEAKPLKLSLARLSNEAEFTIDGFKPHKSGEYKQEKLEGSIKKVSQILGDSQSIESYELYIGEDDKIEKGYSGSAIVSKSSGQVVAVATDRTSTGKQAYAIPLEYLKEVWSELNPKLFDTITPFVGLSAFGREDRAYFFGRDREIEEILEDLKSTSIMAVIGDSGSGKSSLIKAGVIPKLLSSHEVIETRPARNPFSELAHIVARVCKEKVDYSKADINYFINEIKSKEAQKIHTVLEQLFTEGNRPLLIYIDQFEELFTLCDENLQKSFMDTLLYLLKHQSTHLKINIIFTMRRDYYNLLSDHKAFDEKIKATTTYLVKRMKNENLKEVIEKPLALLNVNKDEIRQLSSIILKDMGEDSREITLLQIALTETWEKRGEHKNDLVATYIAIGSVTGALSKLASNAMNSLNEKEQELFKYIFIRVVKFSDIGGVTRRLADRDEFSNEAWDLVQRLSSKHDTQYEKYRKLGRLLKLKRANEKDDKKVSDKKEEIEEVIELIHEALLKQWKTYVDWLRDINKGNRKLIHDALMDKSKIYKKDPQSKFLLTGYTLEESFKLLDKGYSKFLSFDEKVFIKASEKRKKLIYFLAWSAITTIIILLGVSVYWGIEAKISERKAFKSEEQVLDIVSDMTSKAFISLENNRTFSPRDNFRYILKKFKNEKGLKKQRIVAKVWYGEALALKLMGENNESLITYSELMQQFNRSTNMDILYFVARAYFDKASILEKSNEKEAIEMYKNLIDKVKESKNEKFLKIVANTYSRLAWLHFFTQDQEYKDAFSFAEDATFLSEKYLQPKDKIRMAIEINLAHAYLLIGGNKEKAFKLYIKNIERKKEIKKDFIKLKKRNIIVPFSSEVLKRLDGENK